MWSDYEDILPPNFTYYLDYPNLVDNIRRPAILSGGWDEWLYHERDCIAPITFEIFTNATAEAPDFYFDYEENSTHLIKQWNGIYEYFSPTVEYIDNLWLELILSFEYLLDQTPRLSVGPQATAFEESQVTAVLSTTDRSPRIETIDGIEIRLTDGTNLDVVDKLLASASRQDTVTLDLSSTSDEVSVEVDNNFTGYSRFIITFEEEPLVDPVLVVTVHCNLYKLGHQSDVPP